MSKISIKKNFIMNAILTISGFIFPLISFPYVSRVLGPTGTGKVDFAVSFISYFALFANLGIPYYGVRSCAQVRDDKIKLSQTVRELMVINAVMSLISIVAFIPFLFLMPKVSAEKILYLVILITIPMNVIGIEYLYKGLEQYSYITIRSVLFKLISVISLFIFVRDPSDYIEYGAVTIFANSASFVLNFLHSRKYIKYFNIGKCNYKRHFKPIGTFFAMSLAVSLYVSLDRVMLGFMTNDTQVGYYSAAVKFKSILVALVTSLGNVLMPRASYCVNKGLMDEFLRLITKALKFVFIAATPLFIFFTLFAEDGMLFISGREYMPAVLGMQVITPTVLFIGLTGLIGVQVFVPLGKEKYVLYSEIAGAITDLVLNALLIPRYQATGAAIGTLVAEFVVLAVQVFLLTKIKDLSPVISVFPQIKYWIIILACVLAVASSMWVNIVYPVFFKTDLVFKGHMVGVDMINSFLRLLIAAILYFGVYVVVMIVAKDDMMIEIVNTVLKKFRRKGEISV